MEQLRQIIIEECKKYGYELHLECRNYLHFLNKNVREELKAFAVQINEDLERVSMTILNGLGSWNEALESDTNDLETIKNNIDTWLSEESLKKVEKHFLDAEKEKSIKKFAPKIATYIFTQSAINTTTGNWHVTFEEINAKYSHYNIKLEKDSELLSAIEDALYSQYGDAILDMEIYDDEFDLVLGFDYCIEEVDFEDDDREDD